MTSPKSARPKGERFTAFGWSFMLLFNFILGSNFIEPRALGGRERETLGTRLQGSLGSIVSGDITKERSSERREIHCFWVVVYAVVQFYPWFMVRVW